MILDLKNISVSYGEKQAVKDVTFSVGPGEIVGIVGESGSGKSTVLRSIPGLLDEAGRIQNGEILFNGEDLLKKSPTEMRKLRGRKIAVVFQHPELSLDPLWTIGKSFYECIRVHRPVTRQEAYEQGYRLCLALDLEKPDKILSSYPFQLSGGMCQRAAIALAMANGPDILLADEPTSALDMTVQIQVIDTMMKMREEFGTSILIVSHNMGVIAKMADKVGVMKKGELVEWGSRREVLCSPGHAYTKCLIQSVPKMNGDVL